MRSPKIVRQIRHQNFPGRPAVAHLLDRLRGKHNRTSFAGPFSYDADGLATLHNADFLADPLFVEAYRLGIDTGHRFGADLHIEWRVFIICWAASHAAKLAGDFVECGVNTGIYSRAVVHYIDFKEMIDKRFYLLDTYEGIPLEYLTERELGTSIARRNDDVYLDCFDQVTQIFRAFDNVVIVRGRVPATLSEVPSEEVAYLSIDMNSVMPEIAAGEHFWPRLVPGAVVVLDDYGWLEHIEQKHAWDEFARARGVRILALPTGQGLMFKPPPS